MATALFTGAGASRAIGYALTSELLPRVRGGLRSGELFKDINGPERDARDRQELQQLLTTLLPGFEEAADDKLPLITDVFSLVEHAIVSGESLPVGGDDTLRRFRDLLKQGITDVILGDFLEEWDLTQEEDRRQRSVLNRFTGWVETRRKELGVVTTNYDIGLEYELYSRLTPERVAGELDLGFDWREVGTDAERTRPAAPGLRIFKLHGSLDVLRCRHCGYVYFNPYGAIAVHAFRTELSDNNTCTCRREERLELHIVSPSLVREVREANILSVWRSALEWMRRAERWIIVGYSLPPEDLAIRSLLMRARAGAARPPDVTVVQQGEAARPVYELLFPGCHYEPGGLEKFLSSEPS